MAQNQQQLSSVIRTLDQCLEPTTHVRSHLFVVNAVVHMVLPHDEK
jgi:hypothetical protein